MYSVRAVFVSQQQACRLFVLLLTLALAAPAASPGARGVIGGTGAGAQRGVLPGWASATRPAVTLALLLPGTSQDGTRPRRSNAQVGAGTLQFTTTNLADGTMNMSSKAGEPRQDFPQSAIQEFKVFTTQPPAEYGGRAGGVINVITKSGTNSFSGEGYEFFRNKAMGRLDTFT